MSNRGRNYDVYEDDDPSPQWGRVPRLSDASGHTGRASRASPRNRHRARSQSKERERSSGRRRSKSIDGPNPSDTEAPLSYTNFPRHPTAFLLFTVSIYTSYWGHLGQEDAPRQARRSCNCLKAMSCSPPHTQMFNLAFSVHTSIVAIKVCR